MAGMSMQEMAAGDSQQTVTANSPAMAAHPSIGEMGVCEKQSCDGGSSALNIPNRNFDSHFHSALAIPEIPRAEKSLRFMHGARDGISKIHTYIASPTPTSLRI